MSTSWYVHSGCIEVKDLKPLGLIAIGMLMQMLITGIVIFTGDSQSVSAVSNDPLLINTECLDSHTSNRNSSLFSDAKQFWKKFSRSKCFKALKSALLCWQFTSIIVVFILDITKMNDAFEHMETGWDRYKCYAAILLESSNSKTLFAYFGVASSFMFTDDDAASDSSEYDDSLLKFEVLRKSFNTATNLYGITGYKYAFIVFAGMFAMAQLLSMCAFSTLGCLCYLWIGVILLIPWCTAVGISAKKGSDRIVSFASFILLPPVCLFLYIITGPAMINLFSGIGYWDSFMAVLTERHWSTYLNHVITDSESKFRLFTVLF